MDLVYLSDNGWLKDFGALLSEEDSLGNTVRYFYDELNGRLRASGFRTSWKCRSALGL